ncbi:hypothetical protein [Micromonospora okii]|uniref:hypothetical protein n=1 Tax=Micromonospora okii TaxID=1182970 RepID=UPI001E421818|nr:hypothetical protein [Micromonospora okii]
MPEVFSHTDRDGDRIMVERLTARRSDGATFGVVADDSRTRETVAVYLTDAAAADLRDALTPPRPARTGDRRPSVVADIEDATGDSLTVYTRSTGGAPLSVTINAETDREQTMTLTPANVTTLRAALKPHDPAERDAPAPLTTVEAGRVYRLLPSATLAGGTPSVMVRHGVTRVEVVNARPDSDGDVWVKRLNGRYVGTRNCVHPSGLAPLDDAPATPATPDAVEALSSRLTDVAPQLDPARVAAWEKAAALLADKEVESFEVRALAEFLIGDRP